MKVGSGKAEKKSEAGRWEIDIDLLVWALGSNTVHGTAQLSQDLLLP
jgi:hypothetical protein